MAVLPYTGEYKLKPGVSFDASKIKGKSVVLTGGASGMGYEMAKAFTAAGAFVTFGDYNEEVGKQTAAELGADHAHFVPCNVMNWEDQVNLFKTGIAKSPSRSLDIVIANAGISGKDPIWWDESEFDGEPIEPDLKILRTNLIGTMYTTKLALHYLARQPEDESHDRCLILMSSIAAYCEQPGAPSYGATKHGIRAIMQSLRRTSHQRNLRVNLLAPWYVRTPAIPQANQDRLSEKGVEWALASDAGRATLHIASDRQLNGRCLTVVTRDTDPRGYMDMDRDDFKEGDMAAEWQKIMINASHRAQNTKLQ